MEQSPSSQSPNAQPPNPNAPYVPTPPRLAIQRLRLENFKSYGGVVDVGPFHKSFSSIVGPNGSGKSNVIDAMLFVFGRRAKQLRHSKLSELLHNSSTYPNVQSATVTVYFHEIIDTGDGEHDFNVLPSSQFSVARRAFRNNTSKYYLDDREVKMAVVIDLLKAKGVDLDNNRFLILQGEVEQIAMMKPMAVTAHEDGLLEYLEDIIGSNRHIEKIEATSQQVETLNEERSHKLNRVKAAEKERDSLESAKLEAEDYLDKERDALSKKIKLGKARQYDVSRSLKINKEKQNEARENLQAFRLQVAEKEKSMKELEISFKDTQNQSDIAVKAMNDAKEKYTAFERKEIKLREDIKALKARDKKMAAVMARETQRATTSGEKAAKSKEEKEEAVLKIKEMEQLVQKAQDSLDKVRDDVKEKTVPIRKKLEDKQVVLLPYSETVNQCKKDLQVNQSELHLVTQKLKAPVQNLKQAEESLKEMEASLDTARAALHSIETEIGNAEQEATKRDAYINEKQNLLRQLSASCSDMRRKIEEARSVKEFASTRSRLHNAILSASRSGRLRGVIGRLGDLATVEQKYATAVGAAAGASLDNIVVETAENAQDCIQFLRKENLGRATFVILEKVEYLRRSIENWSRSNRGSDGPRLFDFLDIPNHQHQTALYFSLRDTLVADTLEQARRMAFKPSRQNRVVTLPGELIESSGAMTGGGRSSTRYRLGTGRGGDAEMDPAQFQDLCSRLEETKHRMHEEECALRDIENGGNLVRHIEELEVQVTRKELEVSSLEKRIDYMCQSNLPSLRAAVLESSRLVKKNECPDTKRQTELEKAIHENEKSLEKAKAACEGLEGEISSLQEKILAVGGTKLQGAKSALEESRNDLSEVQSIMSRATSQASAAENASKKAKQAAAAAEEEIEKIKKELEEAREQRESMVDGAEMVLKTYKEAEAFHESWLEKVSTVQSEYNVIKNDLKKIRREEVSLIEAADDVRRLVYQDIHEMRALRKKEKSMHSKLDRLSLISVDMADVASQENNGNSEQTLEIDEDAMEVDASKEVDGGKEDEAEEDEVDEEMQLSPQERKELARDIGILESELADLSPNLGAIAEYKSKDGEYLSQVDELDTLTTSRDAARRECDALRKTRLDEFMAGFTTITLKLKELYQMITLGGDAELELVDSLDPFSEGIVFSVRPPKKSWKNISNLSGGEKTLSSLALVFALHHFKPTPLYFLDEIDAALDYKNVSIVANYVKDRTKNAQFIIISLRNNMFELADRLVGIYKTHNTTKSVTVDPCAFTIGAEQSTQISTT